MQALLHFSKHFFSQRFDIFFLGESRWIITYPANRVGTIFKHQIYAQHLLLCIIMGSKPFRRTILIFVWIFKLGNQKEACLLLGQSFFIPSTITKTQVNRVLLLGILCRQGNIDQFSNFTKESQFWGPFFIFSRPKGIQRN